VKNLSLFFIVAAMLTFVGCAPDDDGPNGACRIDFVTYGLGQPAECWGGLTEDECNDKLYEVGGVRSSWAIEAPCSATGAIIHH